MGDVQSDNYEWRDGLGKSSAKQAPPAALAVMQDLSERFSAMHAQGDVWITSLAAAKTVQAAMLAQQPAALAVPEDAFSALLNCASRTAMLAAARKGVGNEH